MLPQKRRSPVLGFRVIRLPTIWMEELDQDRAQFQFLKSSSYPYWMLSIFSIFRSPWVSEKDDEPYNAPLSVHDFVKNGDDVMVVDNGAFCDICFLTLKLTTSTYGDRNHMSAAICRTTFFEISLSTEPDYEGLISFHCTDSCYKICSY